MSNANQTKVKVEFTTRAAAIARKAAVESARTVDQWVRDSVRGSLIGYVRLGRQPAAPGAGPGIRRGTVDHPLPLRGVDRYVRATASMRSKRPDER